jgi:uncharacterized protein YndB with AHSA1/START domain
VSDGANAIESPADREVIIARIIEAPASLLFEAWSRSDHLMKWFGPKGWPLTMCEVDFRVGGRYRFAMTGSSGVQNVPFGGEYLEILPDQKIVFDNTFELPGAETMIMTVTFAELEGNTTLSVHTLFASVAMKEKHVEVGFLQGFGSALDQLEVVVHELKAKVQS